MNKNIYAWNIIRYNKISEQWALRGIGIWQLFRVVRYRELKMEMYVGIGIEKAKKWCLLFTSNCYGDFTVLVSKQTFLMYK